MDFTREDPTGESILNTLDKEIQRFTILTKLGLHQRPLDLAYLRLIRFNGMFKVFSALIDFYLFRNSQSYLKSFLETLPAHRNGTEDQEFFLTIIQALASNGTNLQPRRSCISSHQRSLLERLHPSNNREI